MKKLKESFKVIATPTLLNVLNMSTIQKRYTYIQAVDMNFVKYVEECKRNKIRNNVIRDELGIFSLNTRKDEFRQKWIEQTGRMEMKRLSQSIIQNKPKGKMDVERSCKGLLRNRDQNS